jgi:Fe2+ or Zn2+ uptake regulation protein
MTEYKTEKSSDDSGIFYRVVSEDGNEVFANCQSYSDAQKVCHALNSSLTETSIHNRISALLQEIADEQGILVSNISIDWNCELGGDAILIGIELRTTKRL